MERIDHCTYEHEKFVISFDGGTGVWSAYDPNGEFMTTKDDLKEAMIVIEDAAEHHRRDNPPEPEQGEGDYSHWNEEAEIVRRAENPEIDGRDYPPAPPDPFDG